MTTTFFAMSGLVNCIVALGSGLVVLVYNWKGKINRIYFLLSMSMAFWSFNYWMWLSATNAESALFWAWLMALGTLTIPVTYFHVLVEILGINKKFLIKSAYIITAIVAIFSPFDFFIKGVSPKLFFNFWPMPGPLYSFVVVCIYGPIVLYSFFLIIKNYRNSADVKQTQLFFLLMGSILGWTGGLTNFLLWYNIPIPPYGNFFVAVYTLFIGYAILKNRLFQTKVIAAEIFTFSIWVFLVFKTSLSADYAEFVVNALALGGTIVVGFLLIHSVMAEIKYREKITKAYEVEKRARRDIAKLDKTKSQFIMITQHNLRAPLGTMRLYVSSILEGVYGQVPNTLLKPIEAIKISTIKLISIADEFLAISQLQTGKEIALLKSEVEITPVIEEIIEEGRFEINERGLKIKFTSDSECNKIKITADRRLLKSALRNFVDNAIKYTKKGDININLKKEGEKIKIIVKDKGIGITKKELKNLFTRLFERGERAKKMDAGGKGIGLYLSKQIIEIHKGRVSAVSDGENLGSTFTIELPISNK